MARFRLGFLEVTMKQHNRNPVGFTLIELLTTLAVGCILMAIAAPSMHSVMARSKVAAANNSMIGALHFARHHAVEFGVRTVLCPSRDGQRCDDSQHWENGWLVATDRNGDNQPDRGPVAVDMPLPPGIVVLSSAGRTHVRYQADGSAPGSNLSMIVCQHGDADDALRIVVSNSGRVRKAKPSDAQAQDCASSG